jgi:hypothetical protein
LLINRKPADRFTGNVQHLLLPLTSKRRDHVEEHVDGRKVPDCRKAAKHLMLSSKMYRKIHICKVRKEQRQAGWTVQVLYRYPVRIPGHQEHPEKEKAEGRNIAMKRAVRTLYYTTLTVSMLVGLWHFFVPHLYRWYDYLPMQYESLIVGIDYTNYCFSALLFGSSLILILLRKSAFSFNRETIVFYTFLTLVWIFRACLAVFIEPWPLDPVPAAAIGQLIGSVVLAALMAAVSIDLWKGRGKRV